MRKAKALLHTIYGKTSEGENFCGFHSFSLNYESFPVNHGLVDWQYKSTKMLQQKFYHGSFLPRNFCRIWYVTFYGSSLVILTRGLKH